MMNRQGTCPGHLAVVVAALLVTGLGATAQAQGDRGSFDTISTRVSLGQTVVVTRTNGKEVEGKLLRLSSSSLSIRHRQSDYGVVTTVDFPADDIRAVYLRKPKPLVKGMLMGLGVGAAFAVIAGAADTGHGCWGGSCTGLIALGAALFGGIGAGVGTGIAASLPAKKSLVYERAPASPSARFGVSPLVTPDRRGLMLSGRF